MSPDQPFVLRWGIISTGAIAAKFVGVHVHRKPAWRFFFSLIHDMMHDDVGYSDRPEDVGRRLAPRYASRINGAVDDVVHKVTAVGSRDMAKAWGFIDKSAYGDKSIKAYGTYQEVYADKVRARQR